MALVLLFWCYDRDPVPDQQSSAKPSCRQCGATLSPAPQPPPRGKRQTMGKERRTKERQKKRHSIMGRGGGPTLRLYLPIYLLPLDLLPLWSAGIATTYPTSVSQRKENTALVARSSLKSRAAIEVLGCSIRSPFRRLSTSPCSEVSTARTWQAGGAGTVVPPFHTTASV